MTTYNSQGLFLPPYQYFPPETERRILVHKDIYENVANAVNQREIGMFSTSELQNGQQFFSTTGDNKQFRQAFRKVFELGALAAGATSNIAHNISGAILYYHFSGGFITDVVDYRPLPFVDEATVTNQVSVKVVGANIVVINGATAPAITSGYIVLEYLKN